jgi:levansucrase
LGCSHGFVALSDKNAIDLRKRLSKPHLSDYGVSKLHAESLVNGPNLSMNRAAAPATMPSGALAPTRWEQQHLARISMQALPAAPLISAQDVAPIFPEFDLWDFWPVQLANGSTATVKSGSLWAGLMVPRGADPDCRHDVARTHLLHCRAGQWVDCGALLPDGLSPGSREWSGSALFDPETCRLDVYFTAAGRRQSASVDAPATPHFEQRMLHISGHLVADDSVVPAFENWLSAQSIGQLNPAYYVDTAVDAGVPGLIHGYRDPGIFRDPADGQWHILFTGSLAGAAHSHAGVVGRFSAESPDGPFLCQPPLITADGVANELERPHMLVHGGLYYLFWSSQSSIFAPDGAAAPSGLYGMVAPTLLGPYQPLNGSGLVLSNPAQEPRQAYCWQVLDTLEVISFVDYWGLAGRNVADEPALKRAQFGGTMAPVLRLSLDQDRATLL